MEPKFKVPRHFLENANRTSKREQTRRTSTGKRKRRCGNMAGSLNGLSERSPAPQVILTVPIAQVRVASSRQWGGEGRGGAERLCPRNRDVAIFNRSKQPVFLGDTGASASAKSSLWLRFQPLWVLRAAAPKTPSSPQKLSWGSVMAPTQNTPASDVPSVLFIPAEQNNRVADALRQLS